MEARPRIGDGPSQIKAVWYAHVIVGLITGTLETKKLKISQSRVFFGTQAGLFFLKKTVFFHSGDFARQKEELFVCHVSTQVFYDCKCFRISQT